MIIPLKGHDLGLSEIMDVGLVVRDPPPPRAECPRASHTRRHVPHRHDGTHADGSGPEAGGWEQCLKAAKLGELSQTTAGCLT